MFTFGAHAFLSAFFESVLTWGEDSRAPDNAERGGSLPVLRLDCLLALGGLVTVRSGRILGPLQANNQRPRVPRLSLCSLIGETLGGGFQPGDMICAAPSS